MIVYFEDYVEDRLIRKVLRVENEKEGTIFEASEENERS